MLTQSELITTASELVFMRSAGSRQQPNEDCINDPHFADEKTEAQLP